jgi:hypothetical protein
MHEIPSRFASYKRNSAILAVFLTTLQNGIFSIFLSIPDLELPDWAKKNRAPKSPVKAVIFYP